MGMQAKPYVVNQATEPTRMDLKARLEAYERSLIVEALEAAGGHQRRTAARLGILPTTLHEKMKRLGLLRPRPLRPPADRPEFLGRAQLSS